jgi:sugar (pentulose or hexulose) kinase
VLSVGEALGMFAIDSVTNDYDERMIELFNELPGVEKLPWKLQDILPKVLAAGDAAGILTEEGAATGHFFSRCREGTASWEALFLLLITDEEVSMLCLTTNSGDN